MTSHARLIYRVFKLKGLSISSDASKALNDVLSKEEDPSGSLDLVVSAIQERIDKQSLRTTIVDVDAITSVVADLSSSDEDLAQESIQLFDAFNAPKLYFDEKLKSHRLIAPAAYHLLSTSEMRADMYRQRLLFTQQRLLRSERFALKGMGPSSKPSGTVHDISTIESLLGSSGIKVLLGMLTQPEEGSWFLEDLVSMIRLDLSRAQTFSGFLTEGSQVIVQGELRTGTFSVEFIGVPMIEERQKSLQAVGIDDIFGSGMRPQQMLHMAEMEAAAEDTLLVILSDLQLDKPLVLEKFRDILAGFEANGVNPLYVLIGSFVSQPLSRSLGGRETIEAAFTALGDAIALFPRQASNAKFLFVPGPMDAGSSVALPRRPIPQQLTRALRERVKHVTFASNPCRIRCFTQEIVLFREDLLRKMQQHLAVPLILDDPLAPDITEQLVESLLSQAHLCPLPLTSKPVFWELDHTLRLFPLPHLLVLADHADQFHHLSNACNVVNPGSFASDFSFVVYTPANRHVEFSRVS